MILTPKVLAALAMPALALVGASDAAAVTTIGFTGVTGAVGTPVTSYVESGYIFTAAGGSLAVVNYTTLKELGTTGTATVNLTYGGGTFQMLVLGGLPAGSSGTASISYVGYLGAAQVYSGSINFPAATGAIYVATPSATVDLVKFTLNAGTASNIAFSQVVAGPAAAPVPEPASWAMMIAGFAVVGGTLRHRRRRMAVRFG